MRQVSTAVRVSPRVGLSSAVAITVLLTTAPAAATAATLTSDVSPVRDATARSSAPSDPRGTSPAPPPRLASADVVDAYLVRSWGNCSSHSLAWARINDDWQLYGSTEVHIDYTFEPTCKGPVTYESLVASGADVLILSDVAGDHNNLRKTEKDAIKRYVGEGHGLVVTALTFRDVDVSNHALASTAGIDAAFAPTSEPVIPTFHQLEPASPLFTNIDDPYVSKGNPHAQVPRDRTWDADDLTATARYVAKTTEDVGAVIVNDDVAFRSVFVSTMPEFMSRPVDRQFLYNAITYVAP